MSSLHLPAKHIQELCQLDFLLTVSYDYHMHAFNQKNQNKHRYEKTNLGNTLPSLHANKDS